MCNDFFIQKLSFEYDETVPDDVEFVAEVDTTTLRGQSKSKHFFAAMANNCLTNCEKETISGPNRHYHSKIVIFYTNLFCRK